MDGRNAVCWQWGKSLKGLFRGNYRKYCSRQCGYKADYRKRYPNRPPKLWVHEKSVFETAMELHWSGEESGAIARRLSIPVGTVYSWVHDFGGQKQRKEPLKRLLRIAKSADEWLEALRKNTLQDIDTFADSIHLVCGSVQGQSVDKFATVISERLKENPLSGKTFAFRNKFGDTIFTFAWKPPIFNISKYVKLHGTFVWPHEDLGKTIEITKAEFERLLFLHKQEILTERIAKNLYIMQV